MIVLQGKHFLEIFSVCSELKRVVAASLEMARSRAGSGDNNMSAVVFHAQGDGGEVGEQEGIHS